MLYRFTQLLFEFMVLGWTIVKSLNYSEELNESKENDLSREENESYRQISETISKIRNYFQNRLSQSECVWWLMKCFVKTFQIENLGQTLRIWKIYFCGPRGTFYGNYIFGAMCILRAARHSLWIQESITESISNNNELKQPRGAPREQFDAWNLEIECPRFWLNIAH